MKRTSIFFVIFSLILVSCNTKEKKGKTNTTEETKVETPAVDEHGHPIGNYSPDGHKNTETILDTVAPVTEEDPNKKPDVVPYKDALANISFTDPRLDAVFKYYIETTTALVNGDVKKAQEAASYLSMGYANFGVEEVIFKRVSDVVSAEDIEIQRALLPAITEDVAAMIKGNIKSGKIYRVFCPMAFNNTGGQWLASEETVENPYFGESMLTCGVIQETME